MRTTLLFILTTIITIQLSAQENLIANKVYHTIPTDQEVFSDNESLVLASFNNSYFGPSCSLRKISPDYKIEKEIWNSSAVSAKTDAQGNIYVLGTQGFDYDIILDPITFVFRKYDKDLNLIFESTIDTIANPTYEQFNGDFEIYGDKALIFYRSLRVLVDLENGSFTNVLVDNIALNSIRSCEMLPDSTFIILSTGLFKMDKLGIFMEFKPNTEIFKFVEKDGFIYGISPNKIFKYDDQLANLESMETSSPVNNINIDQLGNIFVSTNKQLLKINESDFSKEVIYENDYHDQLWGGYYFNNQTGVVVQEDEEIINQFNDFSAHGARPAVAIINEQLPDVEFINASIVDKHLFESSVFNGQNIYTYYLDFEFELKNSGTEVIDICEIQLNGDCDYYFFHNYNHCEGETLINLDIQPGETKTIPLSNYLISPEKESTFSDGYEICFSIINVNGQYDRNYSNNSTCKVFELDTEIKDISFSKSPLTIAPNPTDNFINISWEDTAFEPNKFEIYQLAGKLMETGDLSKIKNLQLTLNVSDYANGVYFIRYIDANGMSLTGKFIKK